MLLDPRAPEHEIKATAVHLSGRARHLLRGIKCTGTTSEALATSLDALATSVGARPPDHELSLSGRSARMVDAQWWARNLRRQLCTRNEVEEHAAGQVRRSAQCYVSDFAVSRKAMRAKANAQTLANLEVVNEEGTALKLLDVVDASVSNPRVRRCELMVRLRGFEEVAEAMQHGAVFLTFTCPSRFHRFDAAGNLNPKWDGSSPKQAQAYLGKLWAKIRAAWKRQSFAPYGFRIAEPHHDGCPHWHVLLFAPHHHIGWFEPRRVVAGREDSGTGLLGIAGTYALEDSPNEPGAVKHRFAVERIDKAKGSATGYVAKYISKNIDGEKEDGEALGLDFASGRRATDACKRVRTWAATWGIRQFQQIGGPSVTVWRELRRLARDVKNPARQMEVFEGVTSAADRALWGLFWFLQGGPDLPRSELSHRPLFAQRTSKYGDTAKRVHGVRANDGSCARDAITRSHEWKVQPAGKAATEAAQADWNELRRSFPSRAELSSPLLGFGESAQRSAEGASTWTRVNNCTTPCRSTHEGTPPKSRSLLSPLEVPAWEISRPTSPLVHRRR